MRAAAAFALALAAAAAGAAPVTYKIDPDHTYPSFEADHMGMSTWRGKLERSRGTVQLDKAAGSGTVELEMDLASINFGLAELNRWATSDKFFNVAKNPQARYRGRLEGFVDGKPTRVAGELTLNGVTRPVPITINSFKCMPHPIYKRDWCGADATAGFRRDEFGLAEGKDWGFKMDVLLRIQVEAVAAE